MTVLTDTNIAGPYLANGATTVFDFAFRILQASDIQVTLTDSDGTELVLTPDDDYTVTIDAGNLSGHVTCPASGSPYAAGYTITILRIVDYTQGAAFQNQGGFYPKTHENALDKACMQVQQLAEQIERSVKFTLASGKRNKTIHPEPGRYLAWSATGDLINAAGTGGDALGVLELGESDGSSQIGHIAAGTGAIATTVQTVLRRVTYADDYPSLLAAINATPEHGILQLGPGPYLAGFRVYKSNITIRGVGMGWYNAGKTAIVGGTIVQGEFWLTGDNITVESLGVDCGVDVCNAHNSGNAMNCLIIMDIDAGTGVRTTRHNIVVRDVITLGKEPTSAFHCFLLEGLSDSRFENLHARYTQWGVVLKTENSTADGLYAYDCQQAGLTLKSDTGAWGSRCGTTQVSNVVVDNTDYAAENGIFIYASTDSLFDCSLTNFVIRGGKKGLVLQCDYRVPGTYVIMGFVATNGQLRAQTQYPLIQAGAASYVKYDNLVIAQGTSTSAIWIGPDSYDTNLSNITCSVPSVNSNNVKLEGRFTFNNLTVIVSNDYVSPGRINLYPEFNSPLAMKIGQYIGTLYMLNALATVTFQNGWSAFAGSSVEVKSIGGQVYLRGRAAVPNGVGPWNSGHRLIGTFPAGLAPYGQDRQFMTGGFNTAEVYIPVFVRISTDGGIWADYVDQTDAFPSAIAQISLDMISWPDR